MKATTTPAPATPVGGGGAAATPATSTAATAPNSSVAGAAGGGAAALGTVPGSLAGVLQQLVDVIKQLATTLGSNPVAGGGATPAQVGQVGGGGPVGQMTPEQLFAKFDAKLAAATPEQRTALEAARPKIAKVQSDLAATGSFDKVAFAQARFALDRATLPASSPSIAAADAAIKELDALATSATQTGSFDEQALQAVQTKFDQAVAQAGA